MPPIEHQYYPAIFDLTNLYAFQNKTNVECF